MILISRTNQQLQDNFLNLAERSYRQFKSREEIGFKDLPQREALWTCTQARADKLRELSHEHIFFVGTGGSGLGGKTLKQALKFCYQTENIHFIDNVDKMTLSYHFTKVSNPQDAHWVFISKSGNTMETLAIANEVAAWYGDHNSDLTKHSTVISETRENPLTNWAKSQDVPQLEIPVDVGGRFSILSPVGLLPAALMGASLEEMKKGALWALGQDKLVCQLTAHILQSFERNEMITQFWMYSDGLQLFGSWLQQLWAESLSKSETRKGEPAPRVSTPMPALGTCDQHSILQQVIEGQKDKFVLFFRVKTVEAPASAAPSNLFSSCRFLEGNGLSEVMAAEAAATLAAMEEVGISTLELTWRDLSPETLGAGFMLFELVIAAVGEALNIDAFNQPGVELGKKLAKEILTKS